MWRLVLVLVLACHAHPRPAPNPAVAYREAARAARAGDLDRAFAAFDRALDAGLHGEIAFESDPDLAALRHDPRWAQAMAHWERELGDPALRRRLIAMVAEDQRVRFAWIERSKRGEQPSTADMEAVDAKNLAELHRIVAASGWPTVSRVGGEGAHDAWLLLQHADKDLAFQKQVLAELKGLAMRGEASPTDYAYLEDRVAVHEHRKQTYGTQFDAHQQPQPIEDEAHVDARRRSVGLGTLDAYRAQMREMYGDPK